jgi:hypothetical protein
MLSKSPYQAVERRGDVDRNLGRTSSLLDLLGRGLFQEVAGPSLHPNSTSTCASKCVDVPNVIAPIVQSGRIAFQVRLNNGELYLSVLSAEIRGHPPPFPVLLAARSSTDHILNMRAYRRD